MTLVGQGDVNAEASAMVLSVRVEPSKSAEVKKGRQKGTGPKQSWKIVSLAPPAMYNKLPK